LNFFNMTLGALASIMSFGAASAQAPLKPFKLGISAPVVTVLPVWLGEAGGFFEKNGLKVEVISMEGGTRGTQVLLSGEIQAMHVGLSPVVQANGAGADLRAVASSSNKLPITLFTSKKLEPALPKGAKVGISTFGSETDIALSILLPKLGLKREDVEITQVGGTGQRYAALIAGRLDVAPLMEPAITQAKGRGFIPIYDLSESGDAWIFDSVVVTKSWLAANQDTMQRFLRGYIEGAWWGLKEESKAKELIAVKFKTQDKAVIDATYAEFRKLMPLDGRPSVEGAKNVLKQLEAIKVPVKSKAVEDYVDFGPLDQLVKDGFFAELEKKYSMKAAP
jgi:NitT/TauT family transport system substrate-binding protein